MTARDLENDLPTFIPPMKPTEPTVKTAISVNLVRTPYWKRNAHDAEEAASETTRVRRSLKFIRFAYERTRKTGISIAITIPA